MALVVAPSSTSHMNMNMNNVDTADLGKAVSVSSDEEQWDPLNPLNALKTAAPLAATTLTTLHHVHAKKRRASFMVDNVVSNKRQRTTTCRRRVQFVPDPTDQSRVKCATKEFEIDYDKEELWWTDEESQAHMERHASLLKFYANNCSDLVDSVLLVWVNCAEEVMDDGDYCMTKEQRAQVALKVAQSPCRGFDKEYASELIGEQRVKTIGGILELQALCYLNEVSQEERVEALSAASIAFSQTAALFARTLAQADAKVARE